MVVSVVAGRGERQRWIVSAVSGALGGVARIDFPPIVSVDAGVLLPIERH